VESPLQKHGRPFLPGRRRPATLRGHAFRVVRFCYESVEQVVFAGGWAAALAHRLELQGRVEASQHEVVVDGGARLPRELRIAFASDFHAGPLTDMRLLRHAFERIGAWRPDVVLLGGDFVGLHRRHIGKFGDVVRGIVAPLGIYAVVGNHDLWKGEAEICAALTDAGVRVLRNEATRLPAPFESVVLGGLDDPAVGEPDAEATFGSHAGLRIALMHSPQGVDLLHGRSIAVAFAGHTHGGQVCLPGGHPWIVPRGCWRWKKGRFAIDGIPGGMIVSRGVGCTNLPIRVACPSEVHLCVIRMEGAATDAIA
jgi:predicted MPP superfamily phosphohydrolase